MARVDFPLDDDVSPIAGFAVLRTFSEDGEPLTTYTKFGRLGPEELIGMLSTTLDQLRYEFIDKEESQLLDLIVSTNEADEDEE